MEKKTMVIGMIVGKWVGGGVESFIMNYYRNIDKSKIQFDFICDEDSTDIPYQEIKKMGGNVIICPPYQKVFKYIKFLKKLFKEKKYTIVHSHVNTLSVFPLFAAKKAGVPVRIAHSHSTSNKKEWKKNIIKNLLRPFSKKYSNIFFACSEEAGRYQFGNKAFNSGNVIIIRNAIDVDKFRFNVIVRNQIRKELNITENDIVIGHVGRFVPVKNHKFLIELFNEIHKKNNNYKLMLIGQGPLFNNVKNDINRLGLNDSVIFMGQRCNIEELYNVMDVFVLPSLYEGLGLVLVEAQASGLQCFASTNVPKLANVGSNINFISLEKKEEWENGLLNMGCERINCINQIKENGYDIKNEVRKLENIYINLNNEKGE